MESESIFTLLSSGTWSLERVQVFIEAELTLNLSSHICRMKSACLPSRLIYQTKTGRIHKEYVFLARSVLPAHLPATWIFFFSIRRCLANLCHSHGVTLINYLLTHLTILLVSYNKLISSLNHDSWILFANNNVFWISCSMQ